MAIRDNYGLSLRWGNAGFAVLVSNWKNRILGFRLQGPLYCTIKREIKTWEEVSLSICMERTKVFQIANSHFPLLLPETKQPQSHSAFRS